MGVSGEGHGGIGFYFKLERLLKNLGGRTPLKSGVYKSQDVSQGFATSGSPIPRQEALNTLRRIYWLPALPPTSLNLRIPGAAARASHCGRVVGWPGAG